MKNGKAEIMLVDVLGLILQGMKRFEANTYQVRLLTD